MHIPLAFGLVGSRRQGHRLRPCRRRRGRERRHPCPQAPPCRALQRRRGAALAVAQPRLFGADHAIIEQTQDERSSSWPPRQRPVLALAGLQLAADRRADGRLRASAAAASSRNSRTSSPISPARSPPTRRSSRPSGRWRWHCRARPTSPASSARTSTPTPSLPPARRSPRRSPRPTTRCSNSCYDALGGDNTFSPDAASAGRRALRNVLLDYLAPAPAIRRARGQAFRRRHQHDRPLGGADGPGAAAHRYARGDAGARRLRGALPRRSAGARQMVPDPGEHPGRRNRSSASRR